MAKKSPKGVPPMTQPEELEQAIQEEVPPVTDTTTTEETPVLEESPAQPEVPAVVVEEVPVVVVEEQTPVVVEQTVASPEQPPVGLFETAISGFDMTPRIALRTVNDYIAAMDPRRPLSAEDGVRNQVTLYRAIMRIINSSGKDFTNAFSLLLSMIHEERGGVFHEMNIFRFVESMTLSKEDQLAFQRIMTFLRNIADPKARPVVLKTINLDKVLSHGVNEDGRRLVLGYLNV